MASVVPPVPWVDVRLPFPVDQPAVGCVFDEPARDAAPTVLPVPGGKGRDGMRGRNGEEECDVCVCVCVWVMSAPR